MGCEGCNEESSQEVSRLSDVVANMEIALAPFLRGHPLLFLQATDDVAYFNLTTGWGSGNWAGWALANGSSYTYNGSTVQTYDMRDRVPLGAGTTYTVGQSTGASTVTLTESQLPVVSLNINDPGHRHMIIDAGHVHTTDEDPHTHAASQTAHNHAIDITSAPHSHNIPVAFNIVDGHTAGTAYNAVDPDPGVGGTLTTATATVDVVGVSDTQTPAVAVIAAVTGLSVNSSLSNLSMDFGFTGITIDDIGGGASHNNLQPSSAGLWVQRIG